jgi:hypothetical protein
LGTGLFVRRDTDLFLPDVLPITLRRTYRPGDSISRAFGVGTTHEFDIYLVGDRSPYTFIDLILPDGGRVHYARTSPGVSFFDAVYEHTSSPTGFYGSRIVNAVTGSAAQMPVRSFAQFLVTGRASLSPKPSSC